MSDSYVVPQEVRDAAKRGLELRRKWGRGGLDTRQAAAAGVGSGVARARDLMAGRVSLDTVKRMYSFFSRHGTDTREKNEKGEPTARAIAVLLWGGVPGFNWCKRILKQEAAKKAMEAMPDLVKALVLEVLKESGSSSNVLTAGEQAIASGNQNGDAK